jgi:hypothetical protein
MKLSILHRHGRRRRVRSSRKKEGIFIKSRQNYRRFGRVSNSYSFSNTTTTTAATAAATTATTYATTAATTTSLLL